MRLSQQIPQLSINCYCNELEHIYVHESGILILFRFFLQQVVLFAQGNYPYIKKKLTIHATLLYRSPQKREVTGQLEAKG